MTLTAKQYATLLHWCNGIRAKLGAGEVPSLRKGACYEASRCVLANTVNYRIPKARRVEIDETDVYRGDDPLDPDDVIAKSPRYVEDFIRDFDRREHPELIGRGWSESP